MQQSCQICGFESPVSDRFCRQCGAGLTAETESSAARTRNYGRQESAGSVVSAGSGQLSPSVADAIAGETERYYRAPSVPASISPPTAPIRSKFRWWRWFLWLFVLFIGIGIGASVTGSLIRNRNNPRNAGFPVRNQFEQEAQRRMDEQSRRMNDRMREAQDRAREAQDRQLEAVERAREAAERAIEAGSALVPTGDKLLDLSQYEYPGSTVSSAIRIPGKEVLTMHTPDGFDAVSQFYQKKLGKPVIQINEPWEKKLLFQSNTIPSILISVENTPGQAGPQLKITVLRSPFRIPKPEEAQSPQ